MGINGTAHSSNSSSSSITMIVVINNINNKENTNTSTSTNTNHNGPLGVRVVDAKNDQTIFTLTKHLQMVNVNRFRALALKILIEICIMILEHAN